MSEQICPQSITIEQTSPPEYLVFHNRESVAYRQALSAWPLHITVVPPFSLQKPDALHDLRGLLHKVTRDYEPFSLMPGRRDMFGPDNDTPFTRVEDPTGQLHSMHQQLLDELGSLGSQNIHMRYALNRCNPHVTDKGSRQLGSERFLMDSLTLVQRRSGVKEAIESFKLGY